MVVTATDLFNTGIIFLPIMVSRSILRPFLKFCYLLTKCHDMVDDLLHLLFTQIDYLYMEE